jgi:hypothetical protein
MSPEVTRLHKTPWAAMCRKQRKFLNSTLNMCKGCEPRCTCRWCCCHRCRSRQTTAQPNHTWYHTWGHRCRGHRLAHDWRWSAEVEKYTGCSEEAPVNIIQVWPRDPPGPAGGEISRGCASIGRPTGILQQQATLNCRSKPGGSRNRSHNLDYGDGHRWLSAA